MSIRSLLLLLPVLGVAPLIGSLPYEAVPWTKSFLEVRATVLVDRFCLSQRTGHLKGSQYDGSFALSAAPLYNWEFDLGFRGRSVPTGEVFVRAERQLLCDLTGDPVALTARLHCSIAGSQRAREPIFFEMAKEYAEIGVGIGRHLYIVKEQYIQLFTYLTAGTGTAHARWVGGELGIQGVRALFHTVRLSLLAGRAVGHAHEYRGIGTLDTYIKGFGLSYAYRREDGIEARISYTVRQVSEIGRSTVVQIGLSIPISL